MLKVLEYCLFALIIAITLCAIYVLAISVVYAVKKAFYSQNTEKKENE